MNKKSDIDSIRTKDNEVSGKTNPIPVVDDTLQKAPDKNNTIDDGLKKIEKTIIPTSGISLGLLCTGLVSLIGISYWLGGYIQKVNAYESDINKLKSDVEEQKKLSTDLKNCKDSHIILSPESMEYIKYLISQEMNKKSSK
jgi:hypothetical protein